MARNPRYDILFEPVRIGPVTAPNRFYQVPHASGMTNALPRRPRGLPRGQGRGRLGRGLHRRLLDPPELGRHAAAAVATLWDEADVRSHALMTEAVHRHGALAGVELWHGGALGDEPREPAAAAVAVGHPAGCRRMSASWPTCSPRPWTRPTSATCCAGRPDGAPSARGGPASTSSMSMPGWAICLPVPAAGIQPAHRRLWRQPREPRALRAQLLEVTKEAVGAELAAWRCGSAWRSCAGARARTTRARRMSWSRCSPMSPTCGT